MPRGVPRGDVRHFSSMEAFRKNAAFVHIHGVAHHPHNVAVGPGGQVIIRPTARYMVRSCKVCGRRYKVDVRVPKGVNACPTCVPVSVADALKRKAYRRLERL